MRNLNLDRRILQRTKSFHKNFQKYEDDDDKLWILQFRVVFITSFYTNLDILRSAITPTCSFSRKELTEAEDLMQLAKAVAAIDSDDNDLDDISDILMLAVEPLLRHMQQQISNEHFSKNFKAATCTTI